MERMQALLVGRTARRIQAPMSADAVLDPIVARALARLRDPSSASLSAAIDLAIEAALARPLRELIDPDRVVALAVASIDETRVARALAEIVHPAQERQRALLAATGETLSAFLPSGAPALLEEIAAGTRAPRGAWSAKLIDPAHVRELLAPVLQETLLSFARKLPLVGGGEENRAGKLLGGLARGFVQGAGEQAAKLADLGRGMLGGLGAEMEKRVAAAARDFSQGAFDPLRETMAQRLASDEGKAILARMRSHAIGVLLDAKVAELVDDLDATPRAPVDRLIARTLAHDVARADVQALLRVEVEAFLAARDGATVGSFLEEWNVKDDAVRDVRRIAEQVARAAVEGDAFEPWLRALLAE